MKRLLLKKHWHNTRNIIEEKIAHDLGLESGQIVFGRAGQSEETLCFFW